MPDEDGGKGRPFWEPYRLTCEPIKVQGITVNSGELVAVPWEGRKHLIPYKGWAAIPIPDREEELVGIWLDVLPTTAPPGVAGPGPGPYPLESLLHPSLLEGFIKEIDADN
jgi:hypothetical protein